MNTKIIIAAIILSASSLFSKNNDWRLTLTDGNTISSISLQRVDGDSIVISNTQFLKSISVESIVELRKEKKSKFWIGAGIGFLSGATAGVLIGKATYKEQESTPGEWNFDFGSGMTALGGGVVGGVAGFLVGGIIGAFSGKDEVYNLTQRTHEQKLRTIQFLITEQK